MDRVLSPEEHFLILLMEFDLTLAKREELIASIKNTNNWQKIGKVAISNGLAPLFYKNIQALNLKEFIPAELFQKFKNQYIQTLFKNTQRIKAFEVIIAALNKKNIDFIPLKGIYLAPSLYRDLGLRPMCDIDFMVRTTDLEDCKSLLEDFGWKNTIIYKSEQIKNLNHSHTPYVFIKDGMMIELHQKLYESGTSFNVPVNDLWARAVKQPYLNGVSYQLNFNDLLLHQILHLYKHFILGQLCLKSFVDIASLIKHKGREIEIVALNKLIEKYQCKEEVLSIQGVLKQYFSTGMLFHENDTQDKLDADLIFFSILNGDQETVTNYINDKKIKFVSEESGLKKIHGLKHKINYIISNVFPDKAFMYKRYKINNQFQLLYFYPYRVLSLLKNKEKR